MESLHNEDIFAMTLLCLRAPRMMGRKLCPVYSNISGRNKNGEGDILGKQVGGQGCWLQVPTNQSIKCY